MDAPGLLSAGRAAFRGIGGVGMSQSSRQLLESFYNNAAALFNQLYTKTENGELNNITQIKALRSKYYHLTRDDIKQRDIDAANEANKVPASSTSGTQVDTEA